MANGWQLSSSALPLTPHSLFLSLSLSVSIWLHSTLASHWTFAMAPSTSGLCVCEQLQLQSWLIKSILIDHFATKSICNAMRMFSIIRTISLIAWQTSSSKKTTSKSSTYAKQKGEQESKGEGEREEEGEWVREAYTKLCVSELLPYAELILKLTWQRFKRTGNKARETKGESEREGACGREREREHRTLLYL